MNERMLIFVLILCILLLLGILVVQRLSFRNGIRKNLSDMTEELKRILDQDGNGNVMVFTESREIMELAAQINRLLARSARVREDFCRMETASRKMLSNISHDIRTPMTVVLGYLEMMRTREGKSGEMLEKAQRKAQSVMELVDQFFTLAKLESGDMEIEISRVELGELCRESVLDFYGILTREGFEVEVSIPEKPVFVYGNREALGRIFSNLISNAVRYARDGKYLGLSLRREEKYVCADVTDHGKGIDRMFADHVFDRLFTMEDSRNRRIQGNGLGLTIARDLARQLGGDIVLESVPGIRTVFTVRMRECPSMMREGADNAQALCAVSENERNS